MRSSTPSDDARTLDSVGVTATRGSKAIDKIPGAVSVVTRKELDEQLLISEDLSQVLATQVPGYAPSRQKMTSFGESMRGRVPLILFDGVPQSNPLRAGAREGYFADPSVIERWAGAAPARYVFAGAASSPSLALVLCRAYAAVAVS